jgi:hypothetical protein
VILQFLQDTDIGNVQLIYPSLMRDLNGSNCWGEKFMFLEIVIAFGWGSLFVFIFIGEEGNGSIE